MFSRFMSFFASKALRGYFASKALRDYFAVT
jgi:hypothetical protein